MRILLRAGHLDAPHLLPGVVQLHVHRVDARVVGSHSVAHVGGDPVFLVVERGREKQNKTMKVFKKNCSQSEEMWEAVTSLLEV